MNDKKRMSEIQEYGYIGEADFVAWATKAGFLPTKVVHDHGSDFVCQVKGEQTPGKKSWAMNGHMFIASVRSTTEDGDLVKLNRSDADLFLNNGNYVLAIVKRAPLGAAGKVALKFIDEDFIKELHAFLRSNDDDLEVSFSTACSELTAIRYNVDRMFKSGYQSKLTCLKKTLKLEEVLKSPRIKIVQSSDGGYAVIQSSSVFDHFDVTSSDGDMRLQEAAFGRYDQLCKRLKTLPLHPKILEVAEDFPPTMILQGRLTSNVDSAELEVTGAGRTVRIDTETRVLGDWMGYVHKSGIFIKFSCAIEEGGQHVHKFMIGCDPETPVQEICESEIAEFLIVCREHDAKVSVVGSELQFSGDQIEALWVFGNFVSCFQLLPDWPFVKEDAWPVSKICDEDYQSIGFLGAVLANKNRLTGFGFALGEEPVENLVKYPREVELPVCMNLRGHGVICWLTAKVNLLVEPSKVFVGLQITETINVRFEHRADTFPTGGEPLLKVSSGWGGIPFTNNKMKYRGAEDWGVQMMGRDEQDDEEAGEVVESIQA
jgi:hypothetical protein